MNSGWQQALQALGANVEDGVVRDFGDPQGELEAARSKSVLADLSHLGVLDFVGEDSEAFLHAQLSCDVRSIAADSCSFGSYCTATGRMFASFLLWRAGGGFRMALSRGIVAQVQKRLRMYVLHSKVNITDASDALVLLGVSGADSPRALLPVFSDIPQQPYDARHFGERGSLMSVPGTRYLIALPTQGARALWTRLASHLRPVGTPCWEWLDIQSGLPLVTARTLEQFVPQMANLELIGGVSFNKGCYPGQEIVARTQFLGKVKRRMFLAHVEAEQLPLPGDEVYSDDLPGQASGTVVNAQASPGGGYDLLAVVQLSSRESSTAHVRSPDGAVLQFLDLPYSVT